MTEFNFGALDEPFEADWPVRVQVPQDGGTVRTETFHGRFRLLRPEDMKAIEEEIAMGDIIAETLRRAFVAFGKETKQTFTPDLREKMIATPYVRAAINRAYVEFATGSPSKN